LQPTVKALGERLMLDSGTLTPLLKRLEQLGMLVRQRSSEDEREVHPLLTAAGSELRERVQPLRSQLLCEQGVDLDELAELRSHVGELLERFMALR
jgi:DNA-binding MarR family transcriptional regulator